MNDITKIYVEKFNPNDDKLRIVQWFKKSGEYVYKDEVICNLESSKSLYEITALTDGYLFYKSKIDDEVEVGKLLAIITEQKELLSEDVLNELYYTNYKNKKISEQIVSQKAKILAENLGVDLGQIITKRIITEQDVQNLYDELNNLKIEKKKISISQSRVAQNVSLSHASIPFSYVEIESDISNTIKKIDTIKKINNKLITLMDICIVAYANALKQFPLFNAKYVDGQVHIYKNINVGIALDHGDDLYLVSILDTDKKSYFDISTEILKLKYLLLKKKLPNENLTNSTSAISSLYGSGIHRFIPIIYPEHSCILGISDGRLVHNKIFVSFSLTFDHRIVNASTAAKFLLEFVSKMEKTIE